MQPQRKDNPLQNFVFETRLGRWLILYPIFLVAAVLGLMLVWGIFLIPSMLLG